MTCSDLGSWADFPNGRITFNASLVGGRYPVYTVATYTCNSGYSRVGGRTSTCGLNGYWQGNPPVCNRSN